MYLHSLVTRKKHWRVREQQAGVANRLQGHQSEVREGKKEGFEGRRSLFTRATGSRTAAPSRRRGKSRRPSTAFNHHQYNIDHVDTTSTINIFYFIHDKDVLNRVNVMTL